MVDSFHFFGEILESHSAWKRVISVSIVIELMNL